MTALRRIESTVVSHSAFLGCFVAFLAVVTLFDQFTPGTPPAVPDLGCQRVRGVRDLLQRDPRVFPPATVAFVRPGSTSPSARTANAESGSCTSAPRTHRTRSPVSHARTTSPRAIAPARPPTAVANSRRCVPFAHPSTSKAGPSASITAPVPQPVRKRRFAFEALPKTR